jgi:hypothetical protein
MVGRHTDFLRGFEMKVVPQIGYASMGTVAARLYGDVLRAARLEDIPSLPRSGWYPVGTVEFCRAAMAHQGIPEPDPVDYPSCLDKFRTYGGHRLSTYGDLPEGWTPENSRSFGIHAKPWRTKQPPETWTPDTPFWVGLWHRYAEEWRVYVRQGEIVGVARYDDREVDEPVDWKQVKDMVRVYQQSGEAPVGYAMDIGVSDKDGVTQLVEVNDGWALGLYKGTCSSRDYLRLLEDRWREIAS